MVVDSGWPEINGDPVSRAAASYDGALGALTATVLDKTVLGPSSWCWEVRGLHLQLLKRFRVRIVSKVVICRAHLVLMCAGCSGWSRNLDDATYNGISSGPPANKRENYIRDKTNNVQLRHQNCTPWHSSKWVTRHYLHLALFATYSNQSLPSHKGIISLTTTIIVLQPCHTVHKCRV